MDSLSQDRPAAHSRRGVTYIIVLGATLIVACLGMGGLLAVRAQTRNVDSHSRIAAARMYALSAVELGIQEVASNANWRTTHKNDVNGIVYANKPIGNGTYTLKMVNPNGALDRFPTDSVVLTGTGSVSNGIESQMVEATLVAQAKPFTCLQTSLTTNGLINFGTSTVEARNSTICSNAAITSILATGPVYAKLEGVGLVTSLQNYDGVPASGVVARTMPNPATVFSYFVANGTAISVSAIPAAGPNREITKLVLSPAINPFGTGVTNPQGIYVIDCGGQVIKIKKCRVVGTLVLINPGAGSSIENEVNFEAAVSNFPSLMVQGNLIFKPAPGLLDEKDGNFNPIGTPFPWSSGSADSDVSDVYVNQVGGLIYISGNCSITAATTMGMLMVGGTFDSSNSLTLTYSSTFFSNPPPGFYDLKMVPSPGTWRQTTN
ncbi:MAG: hypothetical protein JWN70_5892 [Planctomycetaceae bacterium]|nr:hypothetical protein [Planctomycetaceae bacterium]